MDIQSMEVHIIKRINLSNLLHMSAVHGYWWHLGKLRCMSHYPCLNNYHLGISKHTVLMNYQQIAIDLKGIILHISL